MKKKVKNVEPKRNKKKIEKKWKKGLSSIVATLLIILLTLVAVGIVWVVVKNTLVINAEKISLDKLALDLDIEGVKLDCKTASVTVRRNIGEGNFIGLAFVVEGKESSEVSKDYTVMNELETHIFEFNLEELMSNEVQSIKVYPIFKLESGKEFIGDIRSEYKLSGLEIIPCPLNCPIPAPQALSAESITSSGFTANWNPVDTADGYYLDVSEDEDFDYILPSYNNQNMGQNTNCVIDGLEKGTTYYYRVRAYTSECITENSNIIEASTSSLIRYGLLYNYYVVSDTREISSQGWHVPTREEFEELSTYLGGSETAGGKLKLNSALYWEGENPGAVNEVGFNSKGSGRRIATTGLFSSLNYNANYWTSIEENSENSYYRSIHANNIIFTGGLEDQVTQKYYQPVELYTTTWYRRSTSDPMCGTQTLTAKNITVGSPLFRGITPQVISVDPIYPIRYNHFELVEYEFEPGIIQRDHSICYGSSTRESLGFLTPPSGGISPYSYQWQRSNDGGITWEDILGASRTSYWPPVLGRTTMFRCKVTDASGKIAYTQEIIILVYPSFSTGKIYTNQVISYGDIPDTIIEIENANGGSSEFSYYWQYSTEGVLSAFTRINSYHGINKKFGNSIRLIKDTPCSVHGQTGTYTGNNEKIYRTICIGTQEWLADNLAETKYRNGDNIPEVVDNNLWNSLTTGALCAFNNNWDYV